MRRDDYGLLIFERMESGIDRERVQILDHALDPNHMNKRDGADSATWRRRRVAQAMVDAGISPGAGQVSGPDRIPLEKRIGNFLEEGGGSATLVLSKHDEREVLEALGRGQDYDTLRGWHSEGDQTAKAQELAQEITDLATGGHTNDTPAMEAA